MKKLVLVAFFLGLVVVNSYATDSTGCGLGTTLWRGQKGRISQLFAVTTNGTSGSQTFGITSGTSHCDPNAKITGGTAAFIAFLENNIDEFAIDVAKGKGETINTVASIANVDSEKAAKILNDNFDNLFSNENVDLVELSEKVEALLKNA